MEFLKSLSCLVLIVFPMSLLAYECDTGELRRVLPKEMTSMSSKKFKDELAKAKADPVRNVASLQKLKANFNYDSASRYLFEDETLNSTPEHFTTLFSRGTKTFYLNQGRLIAILDQKNKQEFLMTRLNRSCQPFEMVSFSNLNHEKGLNVRYKITPQFCKAAVAQNALPQKQTMAETLSFILDPKDRMTLRSVMRDCQFLKQSPAQPAKRKDQNIASG